MANHVCCLQTTNPRNASNTSVPNHNCQSLPTNWNPCSPDERDPFIRFKKGAKNEECKLEVWDGRERWNMIIIKFCWNDLQMPPSSRNNIAWMDLAKNSTPITFLSRDAAQNIVSRRFVYQKREKKGYGATTMMSSSRSLVGLTWTNNSEYNRLMNNPPLSPGWSVGLCVATVDDVVGCVTSLVTGVGPFARAQSFVLILGTNCQDSSNWKPFSNQRQSI